ncbi:phage tail tube protein [Sphingobium yanoikuyae]|uniref:phage tail tube protein n=1 Tax=Sphingobium yanoikuyae TaxID=13690 RepID=UPI002FD95276
MSDVETGHLTEFWLWDPTLGTPALVELGELTEVPLPEGTADLVETSHMKTIGYKSYINAPLKDGEEADLVMNYIPGSPTDILCRKAKAYGRPLQYKIVLVNGDGTWEISGELIVRNYVRSNPMLDRRTGTLRVKWSSEETEAAGA